MTLVEAGEIFGYWERHPPTYQLVAILARMLGWKPRDAGVREEELAELVAVPGMVVDRRVPALVVDLEELRERNRRRAARAI